MVVPAIGLGCMGMTQLAGGDIYGKANEAEAINTIHRSLELGGNFLDTADMYGPFLNEQLVGKAVKGKRDQYTIATKFGWEIDDKGQLTWAINGKKEYVKKSVERSLQNLGVDHIDLYYLHRLDKNTPIEETVGAMSALVQEGKVKYIGLSEVSAATIRKANSIHPIAAVQTEYSLFERSLEEEGVDKLLQELGIGLVAYAPLGRGLLTGQLRQAADFPANDFRLGFPKFQGEQFDKNLVLLREIEKMAAEKSATSSQLALAWTMAKGAVPIPGTKRIKYLEENISAVAIQLSPDDLDRLEHIVPLGTATGHRYDATGMQYID